MESLWSIMGATRLQYRIKTQATGWQPHSGFGESADPTELTKRLASA
jgi:hypothetical protein